MTNKPPCRLRFKTWCSPRLEVIPYPNALYSCGYLREHNFQITTPRFGNCFVLLPYHMFVMRMGDDFRPMRGVVPAAQELSGGVLPVKSVFVHRFSKDNLPDMQQTSVMKNDLSLQTEIRAILVVRLDVPRLYRVA
uniref:Uncharacterized protein n=1 Tax=Candidatus Kentrum sp. FW TaxID=2126338 RepID=A0A450THR1_9GAMM|nr:MAG: hypothetical protein BECKFW1821C_GA0114237_101054 [Candidatus Kentron sp. FW]